MAENAENEINGSLSENAENEINGSLPENAENEINRALPENAEPDIRDLYSDYSGRLEGIEENRYFRYLFEMVRAGENSFSQTNQVLHKVIDESWLQIIEESLDALNRIVNKPRKFIKSVEEVVPVGLAKKITADSVKHLSRNTQFITSEPGEDVQPSKILNVSLEETYDLYENRFIYHLIQRLVRFIDKRTDVIFWATGDEKRNRMVFSSKVDDAYEQIEYKLEMTIKSLTSYAENDASHMETFARIDRVRRLVMSVKTSSFCTIMSGCTPVRSPIQRTNLMIKDPDYRTCYRLWQFLENYDDVGYSIDVLEDAMAFDQEYVDQLYTSFVNNYAVFRSLIEDDDRILNGKLMETLRLASRRKKMNPKFVKEIREEPVESRDIPDVEIRKVFVEEVTEAQIAAEKKAEEAAKALEEAEKALKEARHETVAARHETEAAVSRAEEAEENTAKALGKISGLEQKLADTEAESKSAIEKTRTEAAAAIAETRAQADAEIIAAQTESRNAIAAAQAQSEEAIAKARAEADEAVAKARTEAAETVAAVKAQAEEKITKVQAEADETIAAERAQAEETLATVRSEAAETAARTQTEAAAAVTAARKEADAAIARNMAETAAMIERNNAETEASIEQIRTEAEEDAARLQAESAAAVAKAEEMKAEAAAKLENASAALKDAAEKEAAVHQIRLDADKELKAQKQELKAVREERDRMIRSVTALERKIEALEKSRADSEARSKQRLAAVQSDVGRYRGLLETEKKLRKETAKALRMAEHEAAAAQRQAAAAAERSKKSAAENRSADAGQPDAAASKEASVRENIISKWLRK